MESVVGAEEARTGRVRPLPAAAGRGLPAVVLLAGAGLVLAAVLWSEDRPAAIVALLLAVAAMAGWLARRTDLRQRRIGVGPERVEVVGRFGRRRSLGVIDVDEAVWVEIWSVWTLPGQPADRRLYLLADGGARWWWGSTRDWAAADLLGLAETLAARDVPAVQHAGLSRLALRRRYRRAMGWWHLFAAPISLAVLALVVVALLQG